MYDNKTMIRLKDIIVQCWYPNSFNLVCAFFYFLLYPLNSYKSDPVFYTLLPFFWQLICCSHGFNKRVYLNFKYFLSYGLKTTQKMDEICTFYDQTCF